MRTAQSAGANISKLTTPLNQAGQLLSYAEAAFISGDFDRAESLAVQSQAEVSDLFPAVSSLQAAAEKNRTQNFLINCVLSIAGAAATLVVGVVLWILPKPRFGSEDGNPPLSLQRHKTPFMAAVVVLALLIASPALQRALVYPQTEFFTEVGLLGPDHSAQNYPRNITSIQDNTIYLGISNHLGSCAYYVVEVKLLNETQPPPDRITKTPSSIEPLYSFPVIVADKEAYEIPITFSIDFSFRSTADQDAAQVNFYSLKLNDINLNLQGFSSDPNSVTNEYFGDLVFEIWIYNTSNGTIQYHERFVDLKLNFTPT